MNSFKYIIPLLFVCLFGSCREYSSPEEAINQSESCPCDSVGRFKVNDQIVTECYLGKSLITIAHLPNNDTMEVTRRYTTDKVWHFQEFMVIAKNQLIVPEYALYCNIEDTIDFYKLTYNRNEESFINQGVITNSVLGTEVIINKDTIQSKTLSVLVAKEQFKGIVAIDKILNITHNGKKQNTRGKIYIDTESMIKYGNLLEQYKAINRFCNKNNIDNTLH